MHNLASRHLIRMSAVLRQTLISDAKPNFTVTHLVYDI